MGGGAGEEDGDGGGVAVGGLWRGVLAEVEREEEQEERMVGGLQEACRRWRGWRCGGPEAAAAAAAA